MNVPRDLQPHIGRKELRYSLRTGYLGVAKNKARLIAGQVQLIFRRIRKGGVTLPELPDEKIKKLIKQYIKDYLKDLDERFADDKPFVDAKDVNQYISDLDSIRHEKTLEYNLGDTSIVENEVDKLIRENKIESVEKDSKTFKMLCSSILREQIKLISIEKRHMLGDDSYINDLPNIFPEVFDDFPRKERILESLPTAKEMPSPTLAEVINEYTKRKIELNHWRPNTVRNHQAKINTMLQVLGDKPVNQITKDDARRLAKLLELLPPGFSKMKGYKDISSVNPKDIKGKHDKTMDVSTRRDYLIFSRQIFSFAEENDYLIKNPVISGIIPAKKKKPRDLRYPFDDPEDLSRVFEPELFLDWSINHPSRFWIPLLALYTGCRLEEIASLYCEDIFEYKGLWCIEINDKHDKMVKTQNAIRSIPLHSILVDQLKFPKYVGKVKAQGNDRVFPDLKKENNKYSHGLSKSFGRYLRNKVKIKDKKKTFHSFRHNVTDYLMRNLVQEFLVEELNGRSGKTESSKTYFKGHRSDVLYNECISKLEYKVDLTHLKNSKYVIKD
jgi:integrase